MNFEITIANQSESEYHCYESMSILKATNVATVIDTVYQAIKKHSTQADPLVHAIVRWNYTKVSEKIMEQDPSTCYTDILLSGSVIMLGVCCPPPMEEMDFDFNSDEVDEILQLDEDDLISLINPLL